MAEFFIDRPIFAWVIAILIMLAGAICLRSLPVAQYPEIALPQIGIYGTYPGAAAKTVDQSVVQVIEQQMNGIDHLIHMRSSSDSSGNIEMFFTFASGTDSDAAQVQVQNRLQQAMPQLPEAVQRQGIQVYKAVENSFMVIAFYADDASISSDTISDYVASNVREALGRVQGVGSTTLYGGQNAMRIWLDPEKMRQFALNPQDISQAVREQNAQVTGGQVGGAPAPSGQEVSYTVNAASRLETVEDFANIRLKILENGSVLRLRDVARVELGSENFTGGTWYNGHPGVGLAIKLATGANVIEATKNIKAEMKELSRFFPPWLRYAYADDRAPIVEKSIAAVQRTLVEAIVLVVAVMFVFLQNFRATVIPTITVPVVVLLLGVFAVLQAAGFSINTLTMFGLVLAIGLLVDDAIVVVENVERLMLVERLSPREAAVRSMRQITGALIGVAAVISAVFVPMAFMGGSTGVIYRQFSLTIVSAMLLSVIVAIVLTPALCATMLDARAHACRNGVFGAFNELLDRSTRRYVIGVRRMFRARKRWLAAYALLVAVSGALFLQLPSAFLPDEDQRLLLVDVQLPPGATFERTERILAEIDAWFRTEENDAVKSVLTVMGWGFSGTGQNSAMVIPMLRDWSERGSSQSAFAVRERAAERLSAIPGAEIFVLTPPAVLELGNSSGFELELMDRGNLGHAALLAAREQLLAGASRRPEIASARYSGMEDSEQYELAIDTDKAGAFHLSKGDINGAISGYWGSEYINDFSDKGRTKKVFMQAAPEFRTNIQDFERYYLRNGRGEMVPFRNFLTARSLMASPKLTRFQGLPSLKIEGEAAPGKSSGQAMDAMAQAAGELPEGFGFAWTGLSWQEMTSGQQAPFLYLLSLLAIFLCLAALYESWSVPLAVLLTAPTGIIGAVAGMYLRGMNNDIYFQIAILTIIGLSAKNAILIVEFARQLHKGGEDLIRATAEACRLRLRPILMTSLCFILGVVPLAASSGAGSGAQNALGTAVIAGMLTATGLGLYCTPLFFVLITELFSRKGHRRPGNAALRQTAQA